MSHLLFSMPIVIADVSANWTNKEVLIVVGTTITTLVPICLLVIRLVTLSTLRRLRASKARCEQLQKEYDADHFSFAEIADDSKFEQQLQQACAEAQALAATLQSTQGEREVHRQKAEELMAALEAAQKTHRLNQQELAAIKNRVERALRNEGPVWTGRVLANAPAFKPLDGDDRRTPIISVLNLKGGVGKTTIAANLGACLDARGYGALLIDLDLQGSLSSMFLPESVQEDLFNRRRMLGEFLNRSFDAEFPNLLDYTQPILADRKSGLVATADDLAYAEMNLSVRWLLRAGNRDPRFLLRRELQLKRITNAYDIVLLDCPPILNIFCVNAVTASDYLVIPIMPSKQAMSRVPVLLTLLKELKEHINPHLKVLGIVCNRTFRSEPTAEEANRLSLLEDQCKDVWGEDVPQFKTLIPQSKEIRLVEDERRPLAINEEMYSVIASLAGEVIDSLPTFCSPKPRSIAKLAEVAS